MADPVRVMMQMRATPALAAAAFTTVAAAPLDGVQGLPGLRFDARYSPVPVPPKPAAGAAAAGGPSAWAGAAFTAAEPPTYLVRGAVHAESLGDFLDAVQNHANVVAVFADPRIQPIAAVCPNGPIGSDRTVEEL